MEHFIAGELSSRYINDAEKRFFLHQSAYHDASSFDYKKALSRFCRSNLKTDETEYKNKTNRFVLQVISVVNGII
jgi:hypothetical protein